MLLEQRFQERMRDYEEAQIEILERLARPTSRPDHTSAGDAMDAPRFLTKSSDSCS